MYATNIRDLKKNPSRALREAELAPVVILKGHEPNAGLLHLDASLTEAEQGLRPALAAGLFRDGLLSLGAASKMSGLALADFVRHLGSLGIDVAASDETTAHERQDLSAWLAS